jgi:integrase
MARPATGSVRWNPKAKTWEARVSVDGRRVPVAVDVPACLVSPSSPPSRCSCASCSQARRVAKIVSDKYRSAGCVPEHTGEVANEWYQMRYLRTHAALGNNVEGHRGSWDRYVGAIAGTKPLASWTSDDVKAIRDNLQKLRGEGAIGAKRAFNVWSDQVKAPLSRAFTDDDPKYNAVRVGPASANPALGIKPPVSGEDIDADERGRQPLEPAQFAQLLACGPLSVDWLRECTIKAYSGLRPGEFYGLKWTDVRLSGPRPVIKVQRARNMRTGALIETKNKQSRRDVPIHPVLLPLLAVMRDEAADRDGLVSPIPDDEVREAEKNPTTARANLAFAGVDAPELLRGNASVMAFDDRSWRTTFATWCTKAGYDSTWIDAWLGHKPKTTAAKHYVKETPGFADVHVKASRPGVVPPFPPLPARLLARRAGSGRVLAFQPERSNDSEPLRCEGGDLNPYRIYPTGT